MARGPFIILKYLAKIGWLNQFPTYNLKIEKLQRKKKVIINNKEKDDE